MTPRPEVQKKKEKIRTKAHDKKIWRTWGRARPHSRGALFSTAGTDTVDKKSSTRQYALSISRRRWDGMESDKWIAERTRILNGTKALT